MFNFYVFSAGQEKIIDAGRATTCRHKFRAPSVQKVQKMKGLPKTWVLKGKQFEISDQKIKNSGVSMDNKTKEPQDPHDKNLTWTI